MAALFNGKPLAERRVKDAMSRRLVTVRPDDERGSREPSPHSASRCHRVKPRLSLSA